MRRLTDFKYFRGERQRGILQKLLESNPSENPDILECNQAHMLPSLSVKQETITPPEDFGSLSLGESPGNI